LPSAVADGNFAQDDRALSNRRFAEQREESNLDFQINDETYFASLDEGEWQVFVSTPAGARTIPIYDDGADSEDSSVLVEDKRRRRIVN